MVKHSLVGHLVRRMGGLYLGLLLLCIPALSWAEPLYDGIFAVSGFESYMTQIMSNGSKNGGFAVLGRGGLRFDQWGFFGELQYVGWTGYARDQKSMQGSYNFGIGGEYVYFDHRLRTALSLGMSILATEAPPDPSGMMGIYFDVTPASYILRPLKHLNLIFTPLSLYVGMPSVKGIPLVIIQYRLSISLEFSI